MASAVLVSPVSFDKPIALEPASRFAVREGGKTVGSGVVVELW